MRFRTVSSPHKYSNNSVSKVMLHVSLALIPGTTAMWFYFGWGVLFNITIAVLFAWLSEAAILKMRNKAILPTLKDNSALVSAWLLALALPPLTPWWLPALGISFAIIFGKQLYGGLGYNPFNPAMLGYVVLLICFPLEMTHWLPPIMLNEFPLSILQTAVFVFSGELPYGGWDVLSAATPLDELKTRLSLMSTIDEIKQSPLWGYFGGHGWEWIANGYLFGGIYLLYKRIITWHTPVSLLTGLFSIASLFYLFNPDTHPSALFHIFSGAVIIGAFFIATDPVSSCTSNKGKLIYGFCAGLLIFIIRTWGGYPDAVAFAVLIMNMAAPLLDYYTKPRTFGTRLANQNQRE